MGCKRRMIGIGKKFAAQLAPPVIGFARDIVEVLATTDMTNDDKRGAAITLIKGKLATRGEEAQEGAIRTLIEVAVGALKEGTDALAELGVDDSAEAVTETL